MPLDLINIIVSSTAALITLITGALVWWQTSQHFRHARSASFIERFNSEEYFSARMAVDRFAAQDPTFEAIIKAEVGQEEEDLERARLHVLMFANIFQEIGAAYRVKLVDRHYTWSVFGFLAQYYWKKLSPFVLRLRAIRNRYELYSDFEYLATEMLKLDDKYSRFKNAAPTSSSDTNFHIFAYGSLMSPASARKTISIPESDPAWQAARLYGFERGWFTSAPAILGESRQTVNLAFLALRKEHEAFCNGVLIPVSKKDLEKLDLRERGYQRIEVTPLVFPSVKGQVFTYIIDKQSTPPSTLVSAEYIGGVEAAAASYGEIFAEEYRQTTLPQPFPITSESYYFADPVQSIAAGRSRDR
ncbi:MAG: gamma-glutamylcyclotransferase [Acidobacteria bacterium]|nr:gamma-glutamylcyclotransferase [Acidobacteriota bacterium]